MKVADVFEDEWKNNPVSLKHLKTVQEARTFELWKFLSFLNDKYKCNLSIWSPDSLMKFQSKSGTLHSWKAPWNSSMPSSLETERQKYTAIFNRMIDSKKKYEDAGGTYENV